MLILVCTACIQDELEFDKIKSQNWESEWAIPLINSTLTIKDLLNDSVNVILEGEDGLITLVYESNDLVSVTADEITEIPDQDKTDVESFDLPNIPPGFNDSVPVDFNFIFELDEEDIRVDSILFKTGTYHFTGRSNIDRDVSHVSFFFPNFKRKEDFQPLQFWMNFNNPTGAGEVIRDTLIDLSNYILTFDYAFADTNEVTVHAVIHAEGDNNPYTNPYYIAIENEFSDQEFFKFFGFAGQQDIHMDDTISIDLFDVNQEGYFSFGEGSVTMNIDVSNSFGIPVLLDIETFTAYHGDPDPDSVPIHIFGEYVPPEIVLEYPDLSQIGEVAYTEVIAENSNMHEALEISPNRIYVDIVGHLNPQGNPDVVNFMIDTSAIHVDLALELNLFGSINDFKITDTVDFEINSLDDIESLFFKVIVENGFPINAAVQLAFTDSINQVIYEMFPDYELLMVAAAISDDPANYRVESPTTEITEIPIAKEDFEKLEASKNILITAYLSTDEKVKIFSDYEINLKMGARVGVGF